MTSKIFNQILKKKTLLNQKDDIHLHKAQNMRKRNSFVRLLEKEDDMIHLSSIIAFSSGINLQGKMLIVDIDMQNDRGKRELIEDCTTLSHITGGRQQSMFAVLFTLSQDDEERLLEVDTVFTNLVVKISFQLYLAFEEATFQAMFILFNSLKTQSCALGYHSQAYNSGSLFFAGHFLQMFVCSVHVV